jgi:uncharacterized protein (DUF4415 family)
VTIIPGDFEPDADAFEDDEILAHYLGAGEPAPSVALATVATSPSARAGGPLARPLAIGSPPVATPSGMPDWPDVTHQACTFVLDPQAIAWFRQHHADWQSEIHFVLRAWIAAHTVSDAGNYSIKM